MAKLLLILFCCFAQAVMAGPLSVTENQIRDYLVKENKAQVVLLKKLVNINSGTTNIAGVKRVGEIVRKQLKSLGFKTRWVNPPKNMHRAGTLIAERSGNNGKRLLLIGHLDTVFARHSPFNRFELRGKNAKGPGVMDDKGGIVIMLYALKALRAADALKDTSMTVVLTGDEEDSGKPTAISRKPLVEVARRADVALDFEPAITLGTATISRRGISDWTVETHGNESHSATIFQKNVGDGAVFELSRILNAMRTELQGEKYLSFNPGVMAGGTSVMYQQKISEAVAFGKQNVVSKIALAKGDFRFMDAVQKKSTEEKMSDIVKQHLPGTSATITFQDGIPAMAATENNLKLLEKYSEVSVDLGSGPIKPLDPGIRGAGDISHVAAIVPANLSGLGPIGIGSHSVAESIEIDSLPIQTQRAALFIYRLTH